MELREYGRILLRRWWLILLLPLLAAAFTLLTEREEPSPLTYGYRLQYSVSFLPEPRENMDQDPRLGAVQASEFVADDLTEIFVGSRFESFVDQYLPAEAAAGSIASATRTDKQHRLISVNMTSPSPEGVRALGSAVREATAQDLRPLLVELWGTDLRLELVDERGPFEIGGGLPSQLNLPLRVGLALVAALALAFALDYMDESVRSRREVEALVGPVLGEIPN